MRATASTYAPRMVSAIEEERDYRQRLADARQARQQRALQAMSDEALDAIWHYRAEKAKREAAGKPVLTAIGEWRGGR